MTLIDEEIEQWAKNDPFAKKCLKNKPLIRHLYSQNKRAKTVLDLVENGQKCEFTVVPTRVFYGKEGTYSNENNAKVDSGTPNSYTAHSTTWECIDVNYEGEDMNASLVRIQRPTWNMKSLPDLELNKTYEINGELQISGKTDKDGNRYKNITIIEAKEVSDVQPKILTPEPEITSNEKIVAENVNVQSQHDGTETTHNAADDNNDTERQINQTCLILVKHEVNQHNKLSQPAFNTLVNQFSEFDVVESCKSLALQKQNNGEYLKVQ
jgi:hypothetical protein